MDNYDAAMPQDKVSTILRLREAPCIPGPALLPRRRHCCPDVLLPQADLVVLRFRLAVPKLAPF
eukprot:3221865-Pyramimonas_sp.AAC.1